MPELKVTRMDERQGCGSTTNNPPTKKHPKTKRNTTPLNTEGPSLSTDQADSTQHNPCCDERKRGWRGGNVRKKNKSGVGGGGLRGGREWETQGVGEGASR